MPGADPLAPYSLTRATARGRRLCKTRFADGRERAYDNAYRFDLETVQAQDLTALAALLRDLATRPASCILRGAIRDPAHTRDVRRLVRQDPRSGDAPTLVEVPRAALALDVDSVPLPPGTDHRDLAHCGDLVRRLLPGAFHAAGCVVVATAGHGFKPGARLRLWFMLARPLGTADLCRWLRDAPVDATVFRPAQPIYTAAPLFVGMADPLRHRLVMLDGAAVVVPPDPGALAPPPRRPPPPAPRMFGAAATARFAALLGTVRRAPNGERHPTLFWAALRTGELVAAGELGEAAAARALAQAAMAGGGADYARAEATARDGIAAGRGGPRR